MARGNPEILVRRLKRQLRRAHLESTRALVAAAEAKDPYIRSHSRTVADYAEAIGGRMGLAASALRRLRTAALLHDVGKIAIPDSILAKPGPLTSAEFDMVKRHPQHALDILSHVNFLTEERPLILHHHERYDGQGYPGGLSTVRIPFGARILAVADALDAMFSKRSYKAAYKIDRVQAELEAGAGRQFDPDVAEVALSWLDEDHRTAGTSGPTRPLDTCRGSSS
jgi:HD-GYP domain-containing protein (c-di-GMP phosphodiesterase class II)